jgi:hypothetical protein
MHEGSLLPLATWIGLTVLAQTAPVVDTGMLQLIGNGVTIIVLAWYVVYDVRVRSPAMQAAFTAEQAATRKSFTDEQSATRALFSNQVAEAHKHYVAIVEAMRQTFTVEQNATRQSFVLEQAASRNHHEQDVDKLRQMLFDNMTAMRKAVHDVKDTANSLMLKETERDRHSG